MTQDRGLKIAPGLKIATGLALLLCAEEEIHDLADSWLTAAGMRVISVCNGQDATRQIIDKQIELLVLDTLPIYLPGLPSLLMLKEKYNVFMSFSSLALTKSPSWASLAFRVSMWSWLAL